MFSVSCENCNFKNSHFSVLVKLRISMVASRESISGVGCVQSLLQKLSPSCKSFILFVSSAIRVIPRTSNKGHTLLFQLQHSSRGCWLASFLFRQHDTYKFINNPPPFICQLYIPIVGPGMGFSTALSTRL
jgi:hypothetical protein